MNKNLKIFLFIILVFILLSCFIIFTDLFHSLFGKMSLIFLFGSGILLYLYFYKIETLYESKLIKIDYLKANLHDKKKFLIYNSVILFAFSGLFSYYIYYTFEPLEYGRIEEVTSLNFIVGTYEFLGFWPAVFFIPLLISPLFIFQIIHYLFVDLKEARNKELN